MLSYGCHEFQDSSLPVYLMRAFSVTGLFNIFFFVIAGELNEVGCFRDEWTRALDGPTIETDDMTNEKCVAYCREEASTVCTMCLFVFVASLFPLATDIVCGV